MAVKAGCGGGFDGLCCRMVIETKRVFDGCAFTDENTTLTLLTEDAVPQGAVFESARIISSEFAACSVTPGTDGCCNVCGEIVMTFAVTYSYGGAVTTVRAVYRESRQVLLRLPRADTLVPYSIEATSSFTLASGTFINQNTVSVTGCLLIIIKVTAPVDILIPTYGYCKYPPCTGCVCRAGASDIFPHFDDEDR